MEHGDHVTIWFEHNMYIYIHTYIYILIYIVYIQKSLGALIFQLGSVGQGSMSHYLFVLFSLAIDDYGALEPSPMLMLTSSTLIKWLSGCCSFSPKRRISKQLPISSTCIQRFGEKLGTSWNIHIFFHHFSSFFLSFHHFVVPMQNPRDLQHCLDPLRQRLQRLGREKITGCGWIETPQF